MITWKEFQGKTLWVDSACADCPGFLVSGAVVLAPELCPGASKCAPGPSFASLGDRFSSRAGTGRTCVLSVRVPNSSPVPWSTKALRKSFAGE